MRSLAESLASLPGPKRAEVLAGVSEAEAAELLWRWDFWGRPAQFAPQGSWATWVILAGRGFGKTRSGAEWVRAMMCGSTPLSAGKYNRLALVAETAADARDVMVTGESGILACHPPAFRPTYTPSIRRLTWPNGATASTFSGEEPDQLRGPQFDLAWVDELAKYRYATEAWDMLQFGLRLGSDPRCLVTTTPRPIQLLKDILAEAGTVVTKGKTSDNRSNLAPKFLQKIEAKYAGTRLGRQELEAEILDDSPNALWRRALLDEHRLTLLLKPNTPWDGETYLFKGRPFKLPAMRRVIVAIDPQSKADRADEEKGAETGIVCAALGVDGRGYVLADGTLSGDPNSWARRAVALYDEFQADAVVVETNQGGDMVKAVVRSVRPTIPVIEVNASRGKVTRAEPVAALYEQGRISHVGSLPHLEDQMVVFTPFGIEDNATTGDRVDACVWAFSHLFPQLIHFRDRASGIKKGPEDRWRTRFDQNRGGDGESWKTQ